MDFSNDNEYGGEIRSKEELKEIFEQLDKYTLNWTSQSLMQKIFTFFRIKINSDEESRFNWYFGIIGSIIIIGLRCFFFAKKYAREQGIKEGYLFPSPIIKGQMVNVSTIWRHMKRLAGAARVKKSKVHAHSFRHLFAQVFLNTYTDSITELADILGHKSLETTRLYTRTSDAQKRTKMEQMDFV